MPRANPRAIPVLDGIRVTWEWLCAAPHPVTVPGAEIAGLADRPIPLGELRTRMLDRGTDPGTRDAVWAYLLERSRRDGPTWTMACAGMALPMLAGVCRELTHRFAGDRSDVCSAIVTGFVAAVAEIDLARPGLANSLRWAAVRAGHAAVREALDSPAPHPHEQLVRAALTGTHRATAGPAGAGRHGDPIGDATGDTAGDTEQVGEVPVSRARGSAPPPSRSGHPDLVLADAVAAAVITAGEAALIGETRLEHTPLAVIAARQGRLVGAVTMQRLRAEMRLIDHLLYPEGPDTTADSTTDAVTGKPAGTGGGSGARSPAASSSTSTPESRTVTDSVRSGGASVGAERRRRAPEGSRSVNAVRRRRRTRRGVGVAEQVTR